MTNDGPVTLALLERKPGISRSLFSRYWRDVHGVMAARIPGFDSYTQHHVTPLEDVGSMVVEQIEGIAVVKCVQESDRDGLINSDVTPHIHRDEQNVFRRALLYNLGKDDTQSFVGNQDCAPAQFFLVLPEGDNGAAVASDLVASGASSVDMYDLRGADPAGWNDTDVDDGGTSRRFDFVVQASFADEQQALAEVRNVVLGSGGTIAAYRTDERHIMVEHGRPTALGLRGLDALKTINEAGAENQLQLDVTRAIYGSIAG